METSSGGSGPRRENRQAPAAALEFERLHVVWRDGGGSWRWARGRRVLGEPVLVPAPQEPGGRGPGAAAPPLHVTLHRVFGKAVFLVLPTTP